MLQAFEEVEQLRVDAREAEEKLQVTTRALHELHRDLPSSVDKYVGRKV